MRKKSYSACLMWSLTERCNLDCQYCFYNPFRKTAEIKNIDIASLTDTLNRADEVFEIHFTGGGEPFLVPNIVEACVEITNKHYILFNTNLISGDLKEFSRKISPGRTTEILASLHIEELKKHRLIDRYIENYLLLKKSGFNIRARQVAHPAYAKDAKSYRRFFRERGVGLEFNPFIGEYNGCRYPESYSK